MAGGDELLSLGGGLSAILAPVETLFGNSNSSTTVGTGSRTTEANLTSSGESKERLDISDEAIDKIVSDILSGPEGLASIFGGEQNAGIFDSSVAAQAAGDLTAKITGEIAKLRAERVQTENKTQTQVQTTEEEKRTDVQNKKKGLIAKVFGI